MFESRDSNHDKTFGQVLIEWACLGLAGWAILYLIVWGLFEIVRWLLM